MTFGILDEAQSIAFERVTIADRLRHVDRERDPEATFREAATLLREIKAWLESRSTEKSWPYHYAERDLFDNLCVLYTHVFEVPGKQARVEGLTIIDLLESPEQLGVTRGFLRSAKLLEDAVGALDVKDDPVALALRARLQATTVLDGGQGRDLGYRIMCDGDDDQSSSKKCKHRTDSCDSQEEADDLARWQGWLVSVERDLCPEHCAAAGITPPAPFGFTQETQFSLMEFWFEDMALESFFRGVPLERFVGWMQQLFPPATGVQFATDACAREWHGVADIMRAYGYCRLAKEELLRVYQSLPPVVEPSS